jgi:hypothetical protein
MRLVEVSRVCALITALGLLSGCPKKESEAAPEPASPAATSDKAGAEAPAAAPPAAAPPAKKKDEGGW